MSSPSEDENQYRLLLHQSGNTDRPREASAAGEQLVRLAEKSGDLSRVFQAKSMYAIALLCAGQSHKAFPEVAWCMAQLEKHDRLKPYVTGMAKLFPMLMEQSRGNTDIPGDQLEQLASRLEQVLVNSGESAKGYYRVRMSMAVSRGHRTDYDEAYARYRSFAGRSTFQCAACAQNSLVFDAFQLSDYLEAWERAQPLLNGEMKCGEVPAVTYGALLRWLAENEEFEKADQYHRLGITQMKRISRLLDEYAPHVAYLICRERWEEVITLVNELLTWVAESPSSEAKLKFFYAVRPLSERCKEERFRIRMPDGQHPSRQRFGEWVNDHILQLTQSLNHRNRNRFASEKFADPYHFPVVGLVEQGN